MGYWPKSVKRRRHNWVTDLGRKLVLLGCEGSYSRGIDGKSYWLRVPGQTFEVQGFSEDSATIKGARMMEIIE